MDEEKISTTNNPAQSSSQKPPIITVVADVENTAVCLNVLEPKYQQGNVSLRPILLPPMKDSNKIANKISQSQNPNAVWTSNETDRNLSDQNRISGIPCSKLVNPKMAGTSPDGIDNMELPPPTNSTVAVSNISNSRAERNPSVPDDGIEELDTPPTDRSGSRLHAPIEQSYHSRILEMWFTHVMDKLDLETDLCWKVTSLTAIGMILLITSILLYLFGYDSEVGYIFTLIFLVAIIIYFFFISAIAITVFFYKYGLRALRDHKRS